ncbi:MAG: hypothetical protein NZM44_07225, partial [Candidatus Calescibacterium sp.]|nr:hypothetical protein [Candidatus Calescibacterium sp.]
GVSFDAATDADLSALAVSPSDPQYIQISSTPVTVQFRSYDGRKGLIRVNSGTLNDSNGSINIDVKVQR